MNSWAQQKPTTINVGPPSYQVVGRHEMMPQVRHDDVARFDFLANMNRFLSTQLLPKVKFAYELRAKPAFVRDTGACSNI
ncbi:hypothetical protein HC761_01545, partial [bacterium]|nr:hypothetical protein [bacterium]